MKCPRLNVSEISGTFYVVAGIPLCAKSVRNNNEIPCGYPFMREKTCAIIMKYPAGIPLCAKKHAQ